MQIMREELIQLTFQHALQLNPFDAIFIIQQQEQDYSIIHANAKALILFEQVLEQPMNVEQFFEEEDWRKLKTSIHQLNGNHQTIEVNIDKNVIVHVEPLQFEETNYYIFILRYLTTDTAKAFEAQLLSAKHLYFVEQYVEPVISLDLTGQIIDLNIAAKQKIKHAQQLIGKSVFDQIDEQSIEPFKKLLASTYDGYSSSMIKMKLKHNLFEKESVSVVSFPTYWDSQVIGSHLIIKNADALFQIGFGPSYLGYENELTGLLNRRALNEQWTYYTTAMPEYNIAVLLVDIDRFKRFNESLGKQKADEMLAEISQRFAFLRNELCEVFHYNGDEYVFVIRYAMREEVEIIANKVLHSLKEPLIVDEQEYYVTASIGIATAHVEQVAELETMLHQADQALFHVKYNGRAHYRFYRKEMSQTFPNEALMEAHLKRAIEFNELSVYLQPQLNLVTNSIDSFEALMRWNNRKFGSVPPAQFIPLAESSGLIVQIGDWILDQVMQYQQMWKRKGYRPVRVAINISPKQFKQEGFVEYIDFLLKKYEVDPSCIELEITESSMMNVMETTEILQALKKLGVYVSVDDFGTGYSSLSYLTTYPIDIIKIDQSFIADMSKGEKNIALVKAIIDLSKNLGLEVIAEGVELQEQEQFLVENNCVKAQGYYYNKPMPIEEMVEKYLA
jgi:diguanylate cyclase (GGDEF)-like protein